MEDCKMCMVPQIQLDVNHMMSATLGERGISEPGSRCPARRGRKGL